MGYTTSYFPLIVLGYTQIHLSIEALCATTLLPLGDCHTLRRMVQLKKKCYLRWQRAQPVIALFQIYCDVPG